MSPVWRQLFVCASSYGLSNLSSRMMVGREALQFKIFMKFYLFQHVTYRPSGAHTLTFRSFRCKDELVREVVVCAIQQAGWEQGIPVPVDCNAIYVLCYLFIWHELQKYVDHINSNLNWKTSLPYPGKLQIVMMWIWKIKPDYSSCAFSPCLSTRATWSAGRQEQVASHCSGTASEPVQNYAWSSVSVTGGSSPSSWTYSRGGFRLLVHCQLRCPRTLCPVSCIHQGICNVGEAFNSQLYKSETCVLWKKWDQIIKLQLLKIHWDLTL